MRWPPIPRIVDGVQGPIRIRRVKRIDGDRENMGQWIPANRVMQIRTRLAPDVAWSVLWHEWTHAALDDSGARHHLTAEQTESVCETIAAAQLARMRMEADG